MEHISPFAARPPGPPAAVSSRDAGITRVADLMSPVESVVSVTAPLRDAAELVHGLDAAAVVLGLSHQPLDLITAASLNEAAQKHPQDWQKKRCAALLGGAPHPVSPEDSIEDVLSRYRRAGAHPLLVLDAGEAVGVLYPDPVFTWCLTQPSSVFDALGLGPDPR